MRFGKHIWIVELQEINELLNDDSLVIIANNRHVNFFNDGHNDILYVDKNLLNIKIKIIIVNCGLFDKSIFDRFKNNEMVGKEDIHIGFRGLILFSNKKEFIKYKLISDTTINRVTKFPIT